MKILFQKHLLKKLNKVFLFILITFLLSIISFYALGSQAIGIIPELSFTFYSIYGLIIINEIGIKVSGGYFNILYILGKSNSQIHLEFIRLVLLHLVKMLIYTSLSFLSVILILKLDLKQIDLKWVHSYLVGVAYYFLFVYITTLIFLFIGNKNAMYFYLSMLIIFTTTEYYSNTGANNTAIMIIKQYGLNQLLMSILKWNFTLKQLLSFLGIYGSILILNLRFAKRICYLREHY